MTTAEDGRKVGELAKKISAAMSGYEMPVVATALAEVMAVYAAMITDDDELRRELLSMMAMSAHSFTSAIDQGALKATRANMKDDAERRRVEELLSGLGPKRASPWGEP